MSTIDVGSPEKRTVPNTVSAPIARPLASNAATKTDFYVGAIKIGPQIDRRKVARTASASQRSPR